MDPRRLKAARCFPDLVSIVDALIEISGQIEAQVDPNGDHLHEPDVRPRAMVAMYFYRQIEHLRSMRVLTDSGQHRDAGLIARTMLEGSVQLLWALMKQPDGPEEWYWFGLIEDWRITRDGDASIPEASDYAWNEFEKLRAIHGPEYYSGKAQDNLSKGKLLPSDPYRRHWHKLDIASMFDQIDTRPVYDSYYRQTSSWAHWNPNQILRNLVEKNGEERYEYDDPQSAVVALAAGIASFVDTLAVVRLHFNIPEHAKLTEVTKRYQDLTDLIKIE